jgi:hypothetical protein
MLACPKDTVDEKSMIDTDYTMNDGMNILSNKHGLWTENKRLGSQRSSGQ